MSDQKIKITDRLHLIRLGETLQSMNLVEALKAAAEGPLGKLPGMMSAIAIVEKEAAELRGNLVAKNLTLAVREGIEIAVNRLLMTADGHLIVEPLDVSEQAGARE